MSLGSVLFRPLGVALLAVAVAGAASIARAAPLGFGDLQGFGVVVLEDFQGTFSDIELNLAAGGSVQLNGYSVGAQSSAGAIVAGGDVIFSNGSVGSGGNGSIIAGGTISGNATAAVKQSGVATLPIDFTVAATFLQTTASTLGGTAANGTAVNQWGTLTLTGTSAFNVFTLSAAEWEQSNTVNINTPDGATNIINIAGESVTFGPWGGQISFNGVAGGIGGVDNPLTLYNFFQATSLTLNGSRAPQGSILAPNAAVIGSWGQANGQLFAKSFMGYTQFNAGSFDGAIPTAVPVPAAAWLLLSGLGSLGAIGWVRRRRDCAGNSAAAKRAAA